MKNKDLEYQSKLSYSEQLAYLKEKYGKVPKNYFINESCKSKSPGITRTNEGLFIHHDYEYDPEDDRVNDLSKPLNARFWPWKYQLADNLTYCNWLEHLMLHLKINLLRKEQLGFYINDGVVNFLVPDLNRMYDYNFDIDTIPPWKLMCFNKIEDYYDDYEEIMNDWCREIGYPNYEWKKL